MPAGAETLSKPFPQSCENEGIMISALIHGTPKPASLSVRVKTVFEA